MSSIPVSTTNVAKLITTATGHMIASLILFDDKLTFLTLSIMKVTLKEENFMGIAITLM